MIILWVIDEIAGFTVITVSPMSMRMGCWSFRTATVQNWQVSPNPDSKTRAI